MSPEKTYEEMEAEHFADMERDNAWEEMGIFGDPRCLIHCLLTGNVDKSLLKMAAKVIEKQFDTPQQKKRIASARTKFERPLEVRRAFENREFDFTGEPVKNPRTAEEVAEELAIKYGFTDTRQVFKILQSTGYKSVKRGGKPPPRFRIELPDTF